MAEGIVSTCDGRCPVRTTTDYLDGLPYQKLLADAKFWRDRACEMERKVYELEVAVASRGAGGGRR